MESILQFSSLKIVGQPEFFNYKHFFSVLLLALVDANYKFVYVDVGASGRDGDAAGVFGESLLKQALQNGTLNLPPPATLEEITNKTCLVSYCWR